MAESGLMSTIGGPLKSVAAEGETSLTKSVKGAPATIARSVEERKCMGDHRRLRRCRLSVKMPNQKRATTSGMLGGMNGCSDPTRRRRLRSSQERTRNPLITQAWLECIPAISDEVYTFDRRYEVDLDRLFYCRRWVSCRIILLIESGRSAA